MVPLADKELDEEELNDDELELELELL